MLYGIAKCYRNAIARCACIIKYSTGRSEIINFHRIIIDLCKPGATGECRTAYTRHAVGDSDACKSGATVECTITYARHAIGDSDARKPGATGECRTAYARHAVRDSDACKHITIIERAIENITARYRNAAKR